MHNQYKQKKQRTLSLYATSVLLSVESVENVIRCHRPRILRLTLLSISQSL